MPLVLSLREGQDFFVGEDQFVIEKILAENRFQLRHKSKRTSGNVTFVGSRRFEITDEEATEVLPEVLVSAGHNPPPHTARVAIEAPQSVLILRGEKKRNPPPSMQEKAQCL